MSVESCKPPLVSIVVNNYNYQRFLPRCIDSALRQTHPNTEVVVVDDGSTDGSQEIIGGYGGRIRAVLKENGGQASAFNAGFAASRGEIVIFLDADDLLFPEAAGRVVRAWRPGLAKIQFLLDIIDSDGQSQGVSIPSGEMPSGDLRGIILSSVVYPAPPTSGNAFARRVLETLLPMPEKEWRLSADGYLLSLSPFHGDVASLREVLGCYRLHGSNGYTMAGDLDLRKLRFSLMHDVQKQELIRSFGTRTGIKAPEEPILRIPAHVKARLASLRLAPDLHPFPEDRPFALALRGIRSCKEFRDMPFWKKPFLSMWLLLVALLPRRIVEPMITFGLMPHRRPRLLAPVSS